MRYQEEDIRESIRAENDDRADERGRDPFGRSFNYLYLFAPIVPTLLVLHRPRNGHLPRSSRFFFPHFPAPDPLISLRTFPSIFQVELLNRSGTWRMRINISSFFLLFLLLTHA